MELSNYVFINIYVKLNFMNKIFNSTLVFIYLFITQTYLKMKKVTENFRKCTVLFEKKRVS